MTAIPQEKLREFVAELSSFAKKAEDTLKTIEDNLEANKGLFSVFSERMFAIRGTAQQLSLEHIASIAGLGEEIAIKGTTAETRPQIRKCVGALWDALTTVKYLLEHFNEETSAEQEILMHRLQDALSSLGGARPTVSENEIEALIQGRR